MMTDRKIMQQALEALEVATTPLAKDRQEVLRAQAALRAALAQPDQEPLTDDDIDVVTIKCFGANADLEFHRHHARAIEAKLKEKNA
jgi:hypothetical protein